MYSILNLIINILELRTHMDRKSFSFRRHFYTARLLPVQGHYADKSYFIARLGHVVRCLCICHVDGKI